ncbi:uncharacterized protein MELLADRAFT_123841 [Melampsora larici-populina 98AG31]|uniref:Secreted protein n=1 Tax=Melampsora larici-populina (strain 98AG31 / pathotype 3-4-7) TaxID=747676 RepID=F4RKS5_MELLP|nr:uncharacterized protein MELLADRAFT_123841 [Melampsora larici-populina 98AG31]EGG06989.1 secreted protein [Melampsora larici-populina 98AG31]
MFHHSVLKVLVLLSTFFLCTFANSISVDCRYAYGGNDGGFTSCQSGDSADTQHACQVNSCYSGKNQWVNIDKCVLEDSSNQNSSQQSCKDYMWEDDTRTFSCTNLKDQTFHCSSTPEKIAYIKCGICNP